MSILPLFLLLDRPTSTQRAHFSLFHPYTSSNSSPSSLGTVIHVVGAPMLGFALEFKRSYSPAENGLQNNMTFIGKINTENLHIWTGEQGIDDVPRGKVEDLAAGIRPPGVSANFFAPLNDTTNRRCQEWTIEFVRKLVEVGYLDSEAVELVQSKRDPPSFGIGLRPVPGGQ
ncbi:hypothetical protein BCR34DRAFT_572953 [Clohesyomyces aquaticus]|uniref:Uncharacterized protein n=1 Tax=Clohesyomyces aquaticus TaxID=1231657 RepID=A0A1Y1Z1G6_9PLEO|nr:hypothetical protein BCR34DRAFT_572953 [Clohesyomyces aquaticus]